MDFTKLTKAEREYALNKLEQVACLPAWQWHDFYGVKTHVRSDDTWLVCSRALKEVEVWFVRLNEIHAAIREAYDAYWTRQLFGKPAATAVMFVNTGKNTDLGKAPRGVSRAAAVCDLASWYEMIPGCMERIICVKTDEEYLSVMDDDEKDFFWILPKMADIVLYNETSIDTSSLGEPLVTLSADDFLYCEHGGWNDLGACVKYEAACRYEISEYRKRAMAAHYVDRTLSEVKGEMQQIFSTTLFSDGANCSPDEFLNLLTALGMEVVRFDDERSLQIIEDVSYHLISHSPRVNKTHIFDMVDKHAELYMTQAEKEKDFAYRKFARTVDVLATLWAQALECEKHKLFSGICSISPQMLWDFGEEVGMDLWVDAVVNRGLPVSDVFALCKMGTSASGSAA